MCAWKDFLRWVAAFFLMRSVAEALTIFTVAYRTIGLRRGEGTLGFEVDFYCLARGDRGACYAKYEIIKATYHGT